MYMYNYVAISAKGRTSYSSTVMTREEALQALYERWKEDGGLVAAFLVYRQKPTNVLRLIKAKINQRKPKLPKSTADWKAGVAKFSVEKASEGGISYRELSERLAAEGIPCRKGYTIYVGQYGIEVPKAFEKAADRIIFPE